MEGFCRAGAGSPAELFKFKRRPRVNICGVAFCVSEAKIHGSDDSSRFSTLPTRRRVATNPASLATTRPSERRCAWNEDEERERRRRQKVQLQDADAADVHGAEDEMLNTRSTATHREP